MSYDVFVSQVMSLLKQHFGSDYSISVHQVPKNNGLLFDGLSISRRDCSIAPTIYLNPLYARYQKGVPLEELLTEIIALYQENASLSPINPELLSRTDFVLPRLAVKLIHRQSNNVLLEQVPFRPFLDLAIVCFLYLGVREGRQMTVLVSYAHLNLWDLNQEVLFRIALLNTPRLFPFRLCSVKEAGEEMLGSLPKSANMQAFPHNCREEPEFLYLLTNRLGLDGAAAMLYPSVLKDFSNQEEKDLIIFPSSVHEVLLLPVSDPSQGTHLSSMVREINQAQVPREERLSNQVYLYRRSTGEFSILSESGETIL